MVGQMHIAKLKEVKVCMVTQPLYMELKGEHKKYYN
jgi:hypothetical protein